MVPKWLSTGRKGIVHFIFCITLLNVSLVCRNWSFLQRLLFLNLSPLLIVGLKVLSSVLWMSVKKSGLFSSFACFSSNRRLFQAEIHFILSRTVKYLIKKSAYLEKKMIAKWKCFSAPLFFKTLLSFPLTLSVSAFPGLLTSS